MKSGEKPTSLIKLCGTFKEDFEKVRRGEFEAFNEGVAVNSCFSCMNTADPDAKGCA